MKTSEISVYNHDYYEENPDLIIILDELKVFRERNQDRRLSEITDKFFELYLIDETEEQ